jgi:hypothetical protein
VLHLAKAFKLHGCEKTVLAVRRGREIVKVGEESSDRKDAKRQDVGEPVAEKKR